MANWFVEPVPGFPARAQMAEWGIRVGHCFSLIYNTSTALLLVKRLSVIRFGILQDRCGGASESRNILRQQVFISFDVHTTSR